MIKNFSETERYIKSFFPQGNVFKINDKTFKVLLCGKPGCPQGEPKTDVYIKLEDVDTNKIYETKISIKQDNADFLENKIKAERANIIFGEDWSKIITNSTCQLQAIFNNKKLIYKNKQNKTQAGSITLGWKFELLNKISGELSEELVLNETQLLDIYSGNNLPDDKKNAIVEGQKINDSGVANFILIYNNEQFTSVQALTANLQPITEFIKSHPKIYFACKALNYRTFKQKYDGDRPLSVFVDWNVLNGKLTPTIKFNNPLTTTGNVVAEKLISSLQQLNIQNTDDINSSNVSSLDYIFE